MYLNITHCSFFAIICFSFKDLCYGQLIFLPCRVGEGGDGGGGKEISHEHGVDLYKLKQ